MTKTIIFTLGFLFSVTGLFNSNLFYYGSSVFDISLISLIDPILGKILSIFEVEWKNLFLIISLKNIVTFLILLFIPLKFIKRNNLKNRFTNKKIGFILVVGMLIQMLANTYSLNSKDQLGQFFLPLFIMLSIICAQLVIFIGLLKILWDSKPNSFNSSSTKSRNEKKILALIIYIVGFLVILGKLTIIKLATLASVFFYIFKFKLSIPVLNLHLYILSTITVLIILLFTTIKLNFQRYLSFNLKGIRIININLLIILTFIIITFLLSSVADMYLAQIWATIGYPVLNTFCTIFIFVGLLRIFLDINPINEKSKYTN